MIFVTTMFVKITLKFGEVAKKKQISLRIQLMVSSHLQENYG